MPKFNELAEDALDDDDFGWIAFYERDSLVLNPFSLPDIQFVERFAFLVQKQSPRSIRWRSAGPISLLGDLGASPPDLVAQFATVLRGPEAFELDVQRH